jgi:ribose transport system permease protein
MTRKKIQLSVLVPFFILVFMIVCFDIATRGRIYSSQNIMNLFNQSVAIVLGGLGMMMVAAMGATDITQGSLLALASFAGCSAAVKFGSPWMFPAAIATGVISGLFLGEINARLKVSSFMVSLAMLIAIRALVNWLLASNVIMVPANMLFLDNIKVKLPVVILLILLTGYIFNYTRFGSYVKAIGENENAVKMTGIDVSRIKVAAFIMSGIMASIAGVFTLIRVGGVNNTMGSGFEMKVMMAMFIGGIPVSGGTGTKLYKLVIGTLMIVLLENGLVMCGATGSITQGIRGLMLLSAVYLTMVVTSKVNLLDKKNAAAAN